MPFIYRGRIIRERPAYLDTYMGGYHVYENPSEAVQICFKGEYVVPDNIKTIEFRAFEGCKGLTSITIPNSVTSIGEYAFSGCTSLKSITIPNSVTSIGANTFSGCTGLTSITIPNSVKSIGEYAFSGCTGLTSITIPNSVKSIAASAFSGCTKLTSITIPNGVENIDIYGGTGLTSITIPKNAKSIGNNAFSGSKKLKSITIPNSVKSIGKNAFYGCENLEKVTIDCEKIGGAADKIPENQYGQRYSHGCPITYDGYPLFANSGYYGVDTSYRSPVKEVIIGNNAKEILPYAFYGCNKIEKMTSPESVTTIGDCAFLHCDALSTLILPDKFCHGNFNKLKKDWGLPAICNIVNASKQNQNYKRPANQNDNKRVKQLEEQLKKANEQIMQLKEQNIQLREENLQLKTENSQMRSQFTADPEREPTNFNSMKRSQYTANHEPFKTLDNHIQSGIIK